MISQLTGKVTFENENSIVIDVGGVGYKTFVSSETLMKMSGKVGDVVIWTHMAVRENSIDLYGFTEKADLDFFEMLISISGIGPKSALGILNVASTETLIQAISSEDTSYLTKVSGIGKKSAQKIVLELKDKIGETTEGGNEIREEIDAVEALKSLGYSTREASGVLKKVDKTADTGDMVKEALKILAK